jgi:adenosylcobinamide kinase / adenosylcobinamide-phosphate guanylyltransferase
VSHEVGQGIVPDSERARRFRDEAGSLNQAITTVANDVMFIIAGLSQKIK